MITAVLWTDVETSCICKWLARPDSWILTQANPACPVVHEEDPPA